MTAHKSKIRVTGLSISYGRTTVQENLNFSIMPQEIFIIMGGSGCGKSSLLKVMVGLKAPKSGDVEFESSSYWQSSVEEQESIRREFGVLFQSGALWSSMTLAENVELALEYHTNLPEKERRELAQYKLMLVGLRGFEDYYPNEISGGMKKRAGLARAMALDPSILFFDEPSAGLDPINARLLDDLILELRDGLGATIVVVTHELSSIFAIGDSCVFLDPQTKTQIASGNPVQMRDSHPDQRVRAFLNRKKPFEYKKL